MMNTVENHPPFFIVGSGRSGSTLLRMILCTHSMVTIPPETYFIAPLVKQLPTNSRLTPEQVSTAIDIITSHYRWPDMDMEKSQLEKEAAIKNDPYLRDILNIIYDYHLAKEGKSAWGDKTPMYVSEIPQLRELYPQARFIHLIRDGRDVAYSFKATGWYGPWLHDCTTEWKQAIKHFNYYKKHTPEISILEIRYEDLVLRTEQTTRALCAHLNLDFEPGMLEWENTIEGNIPAREAHIHKKLYRKPSRQDIYRWKHEMNRREILVAESFIGNELRSVHYELHYSSPVWKPVFFATRLYCRFLLPILSRMARLPRYILSKLGVQPPAP